MQGNIVLSLAKRIILFLAEKSSYWLKNAFVG
jgi:hypothetical protein